MPPASLLSDHQHPAIQAKADDLTSGRPTLLDQVESIFNFVRDEIRFGFPPRWDAVKASETLQYGVGYCTTKATLFVALSRAAGIPARVHTGLIDVRIMRGIFPSLVLRSIPDAGGHAWTEVEIEGEWKPLDSYINDKTFYRKALRRLEESGNDTGFSISRRKGPSSCEFNFGEKGFVHMGAVVEDHGTWSDFSEYMASDKYLAMNRLQSMAYPMLAKTSNRAIERLRA